MSLVKTSTLNGLGLAVKLLVMLLVNKVVAVVAGPAGLAVYGQFQSLMTLVNGLAAAPGQAGIVRLTAANQQHAPTVHQYWAAALRAVLLNSAVFAVLGMVLSPWLAAHVLRDSQLVWPLALFFLSMPAAAVLTLLLSCANGLSAIRDYVLVGIIMALVVNLAAIAGMTAGGVSGLITAVAVGQLLALVVVLGYLQSASWFARRYFLAASTRAALKQVFALSAMAFVAVVCAPLIQIAIRQLMTDRFGLAQAGYWQGVSRLGDMYVMVVTALLGVYYFPRFSAASSPVMVRAELRRFFYTVYPLFLAGYAVVVVYREFFIKLVYAPEFLPAAQLLPLQMLSDAMRLLSWLSGYLVMARGSPKVFVAAELAVALLWVGLADVFMARYGYQGALYASTLSNLVYAVVLVCSLVRGRQI